MKPANCRAVRVSAPAGASAQKPSGGVGAATESGVAVWQSRLSEKLNGASPAPVVITGESQEGSLTLHLVVADFIREGGAEE